MQFYNAHFKTAGENMKKTIIISLSLLTTISAYAMEVTLPSKDSHATPSCESAKKQEPTDLQKLIALQQEQNELLKLNIAATLVTASSTRYEWSNPGDVGLIKRKALNYVEAHAVFLKNTKTER